ncbi:MAG: hypothetical protein K2K70_03110 [Lachnospiraceae bacterium]|nr:hypothetical protein [Lachnospiraceae bacterium]
MNKCKKCGVTIADQTRVCPLCYMVLTIDEQKKPSKTYPNITEKRKLWTKIWKIATFVLVLVQIFLIGMNVAYYQGIRWSMISGVAILYLLISLHQLILHPDSLVRKLFRQTVMVWLLLLAIDLALRFRGWSFTIGIPCVILSLNAIVLVCMIVQFRNWQNYLLLQMFALLVSIFAVVLWVMQRHPYGILAWITLGITAIFFGFCVFFGNTKAKNELRRRFYI